MTTADRLAVELEAVHAPKAMIVAARAGCYDDFLTESPTPIMDLVRDCRTAGLQAFAQRAIDGEFDATPEESDAWARSDSGRETLAAFGVKK